MTDLTPAPHPSGGEFLFYQADDGRIRLQVRVQQETAWLSLNQMADLFQRDKSVISRHIRNVFQEGELTREATVAKSATVQTEGGKPVTRDIEFFCLDVIISVGYRVKSHRGTQLQAAKKAELEFEKYHRAELAQPSKVELDFDAVVKEIKELPAPHRTKGQA